MDLLKAMRIHDLSLFGSESALTSPRVNLQPPYEMRVWEIAKYAGVQSKYVMRLLRSLGKKTASASSKVEIEYFELEALTAILREQKGLRGE